MAGLTVAIQKRSVFGNKRVRVVDVDFDSSYPTGGESLTAADLGLSVVDIVIPSPKSGYVFEYDYTNSKLKAYWADYDAGADGALIEVGNGTDLHTVTDVRLLAMGI